MSIHDGVRQALAVWPNPIFGEGRVVVPTHCLYPSNGIINAIVEGGSREYRVHDDGGALDEFESSGGRLRDGLPILRIVAARQGLSVSNFGIIRSPLIGQSELAATICLVANASKEGAHELVDRLRPPSKRNFRAELAKMLEVEFGHDRIQRTPVIGRSNKPHKFDYVIQIARTRRLLLDAVTPEPSSISAAVVAHLDVREANRPELVQRIVYDDDEPWNAADLNILAMGAPVVAFSAARNILAKLAA
jgi:hypothetical protein